MESNSDKLYFYSKSKDLPPGKGTREEATQEYPELKKIKDWRKILSNFHISPFLYNDKTYNSIEHAFQASKVQIANYKLAEKFTLESEDAIALGGGELAKKAGRNLIKLNTQQVQTWNTIKNNIMYEISLAKYSQCDIARDVLIATKNAQLWHILARSSKSLRFTHLENIRNILSNSN
jgi:ribA/ribD-fused uncharacterized protein